jgi:hypothetical protein
MLYVMFTNVLFRFEFTEMTWFIFAILEVVGRDSFWGKKKLLKLQIDKIFRRSPTRFVIVDLI